MSDTDPAVRKTPLHDLHVAAGARMAPFAGFSMPMQYAGVIAEHQAVRDSVGMFDVSHMGELMISGPGAEELVQHLSTNDISRVAPGRAQYALMCNEEGGIVDDLLIYRLADDEFMLVVNASNIEKDHRHLTSIIGKTGSTANLVDRSDQTALIAVQGPRSLELVEKTSGLSLSELKPFAFLRPGPDEFFGSREAIVSRTGYTGESGLEIYCEPERAEFIWQALLDADEGIDVARCGLGARDTLRLEAGFGLYGNDLDENTTPLEAGLGWAVKFDKGDFVGREALERQKADGVSRRLIGFGMMERAIPRQGYAIQDEAGEVIGEVTSGGQSPILQRGIGMGHVVNDDRFTSPGSKIFVSIRGRSVPAQVARPPFHKNLS